MFISDIKRVVEQVSRDKGINREVLIKALEEALRSAAKKKFGTKVDIEAQYNDESGEIEVFQFKEVVDVVTEPDLQISYEEGKNLDPECEVGDSLGTKIDATTFGRIAAQSAKQVIIQKMKDAERDAVYSNFIERKGEIINGIVQRVDRGDIVVNLGTTEAILPGREQIPKESYRRGDRIRALIYDVLYDTRGPQIVLTRTHPDFLVSLFKTEVPEISEGIVEIKGASREPGSRAKIAVSSHDSDIDPVGACVGMKGSRVQNVVQELRGEKIDIIPWHIDAAKFVCNALAPAEISRVIIDEENRSMEVIVPDEFLSVAIGKKGQNVRLASRLTGWHLDVTSESRYSQAMQTGYEALVQLPGIGISVADALFEKGFLSLEDLAAASAEELTSIRGIGAEKAVKLIESAKLALQTGTQDPLPETELPQKDEFESESEESESEESESEESESEESESEESESEESESEESESEESESEESESEESESEESESEESESEESESEESDRMVPPVDAPSASEETAGIEEELSNKSEANGNEDGDTDEGIRDEEAG